MPHVTMRLAAFLLAASATSCGRVTGATCTASCDASLVVYGRASISWSGTAVPGATIAVQLYGDTTRVAGDCAGTIPLAVATQPIDSAGNYRLPILAPGAAARWVCVEVTADPHNWASDVGPNHVSGGVVQLRAAPDGAQGDSVRVDIHYSGLA